jgi:hypothetical protein
MDMSDEEILVRCDISVRVFVRSTRESRPSSEERRRIERCGTGREEGVGGEDDSIDGTWGARRERAGCWGPK